MKQVEASIASSANRIKEIDRKLKILTNPFDNMDWQTKKHVGIYLYYLNMASNNSVSHSQVSAAEMVDVDPNTLRIWIKDFEDTETLGNFSLTIQWIQ